MKRGLLVCIVCASLLIGSGPVDAAPQPSDQASIAQCAEVQPHEMSVPLQLGDLMKTASEPAIYFYAADHQRYVFPTANVFFSWCEDFSQVKILPAEDLGALPIGGTITYRPGSRLVKFPSSPKVYLVTRGGVLRWLTSPAVARGIYGPLWTKMIDDVPQAFVSSYQFGPAVKSPTELSLLDIVASTGNSIDANLGLTK